MTSWIGHGADFFLGFVSVPAPEAEAFTAGPVAPRNYRKPEAIAEYAAKWREMFAERAAQAAVTGSLVRVRVETAAGVPLLDVTGREPGEASAALVRWLLETEFEEYPATVARAFTPRRRLWGLDVDRALRIAGLEALRLGGKFGLAVAPPLRLWHQNAGAHDPFDVVAGPAERGLVDVVGLCRYLGVDVTRADLDPVACPHVCLNLTRLARELCLRAGLVDPPDEE